CTVGPLQPAQRTPEIWCLRVSDHLVVGRQEGCQFGNASVKGSLAELTRRDTLVLGAGALASALVSPANGVHEGPEFHGLSACGELKYAADFKHFDYVEPNAPKGGAFSQIGPT